MLMQILLFLIVIFLSWPINVLAKPSLPLSKPNCQSSCGNVSILFPYGIGPNCYLNDSFAVDCKSHKPFLKIINLEVLLISLRDFTIRVNHPVLNSCLSSEPTILENTPFLFSDRNIFVSVACNNFASMSFNHSPLCGCLSICDNIGGSVEMGNCFGVNCCQTTIPRKLKSYKTSFNILNNSDQGDKNQQQQKCKYAFLVDHDLFSTVSMSAEDVANMTQVPVLLNWNIHESSFDLSTNNKSHDYRSSTNCKAFDDGSVHCRCVEGYGGNPFLPDGCQDVDECTMKNITCEPPTICKNTKGSYGCYPPESSKVYIIISGISAGLGSLFLLIGAWWLWTILKKRKEIKRKEKFFKRNGGLLLQQQLNSFEAGADGSRLFNSRELDKATEHFNVSRILGQGGQGTVYKGMLTDGRIIAVKKSKVVDERKVEEFINEVVILSQINHRNVVKLLGCCLETEVPLLVYEYIPNGTLSHYLHDQNEEFLLSWDMRLRIATEVAGALSYLHSAASFPIYHRDIKSLNILLDDKYRAKVADFGTSKTIANIDQTHVTTKVQGTFGYLDPEYFQSSQFTDKSDVYSFGVVLVELLTGQKPTSVSKTEEGQSLIAYFIGSMEENCLYDILDNQVSIFGKKEAIMAITNLAKRCLNLNGRKRPAMKEVAMELEGIRTLQKDGNFQKNYEEIEYVRSEKIEPWDVVSTSTGSTFENFSPSQNARPLLVDT
ncbi:hypothetical protein ACOSQ4_004216 [Xanthoceras sorbifolium]